MESSKEADPVRIWLILGVLCAVVAVPGLACCGLGWFVGILGVGAGLIALINADESRRVAPVAVMLLNAAIVIFPLVALSIGSMEAERLEAEREAERQVHLRELERRAPELISATEPVAAEVEAMLKTGGA